MERSGRCFRRRLRFLRPRSTRPRFACGGGGWWWCPRSGGAASGAGGAARAADTRAGASAAGPGAAGGARRVRGGPRDQRGGPSACGLGLREGSWAGGSWTRGGRWSARRLRRAARSTRCAPHACGLGLCEGSTPASLWTLLSTHPARQAWRARARATRPCAHLPDTRAPRRSHMACAWRRVACVELYVWWSHLWQAGGHIANRISARGVCGWQVLRNKWPALAATLEVIVTEMGARFSPRQVRRMEG